MHSRRLICIYVCMPLSLFLSVSLYLSFSKYLSFLVINSQLFLVIKFSKVLYIFYTFHTPIVILRSLKNTSLS